MHSVFQVEGSDIFIFFHILPQRTANLLFTAVKDPSKIAKGNLIHTIFSTRKKISNMQLLGNASLSVPVEICRTFVACCLVVKSTGKCTSKI